MNEGPLGDGCSALGSLGTGAQPLMASLDGKPLMACNPLTACNPLMDSLDCKPLMAAA